jgi:hypothetical protein
MGFYLEDRTWSDQFIPAIRQIVGPHLLVPSSMEVDVTQAADLVVFTAKNMLIAARMRRREDKHGRIYAEEYPFDFTVRSRRDSGAKTELTKIVSGWGDWLFYGHEVGPGAIGLWWLIDLKSFRLGFAWRNTNGLVWRLIDNSDGTYGIAFDIRSFPTIPRLLIASSGDAEAAA